MLERIDCHAKARPDEGALVFLSRSSAVLELSWAGLQGRLRAVGSALVRAGVLPGDIVFILSASPYEEVLGFLGAMAAGALPSILSFPSLKQSEERFHETLRPITLSTGAKWIITSREFTGVVTRAGLPAQVIEFPPEEVLSSAVEASLPAPSADFLQFSSGTTGLRKCVRITGGMMASQARTYSRALGLTPSDRIASWLPLYHDMGLVACLLVPLYQGLMAAHMSPFEWLAEPALLFKAISTYRATLVWLPNFAYKLCAERIPDEELAGVELGSLRAFINCSEPVRHRSHEQFLRRFERWGLRPEHLHACYAMAETTFAVTQTELGRPVREDRVLARAVSSEHQATPAPEGTPEPEVLTFVSCGRPIEELEVRIAGEGGERRVGEIQVRGSSLIPGYGVEGRATLDAFTEDGWYKTGDLGYLAEGELYVSGRAKDLIIHRGHNVYPSDVEEAAGEVPGIKGGRLVVFGLFDEAAGTEDIIVMIEPERPEADPEALRRQIREQVWARLNVAVADVDVVGPGTLLKSTSGKLSRSANRKLYLQRRQDQPRSSRQRPEGARPYAEPRDLWERQMVWIWEEVLGAGPVGLNDNPFLDWGATSVSALRVASEVERRLARTVQPAELLGAQTVEGQAALLRDVQSGAGSPLVLLQPHGSGRPIFLVHAAGGWAFPYVTLVRHLGEERKVYAFQAPHLVRGGAETMTVAGLASEYLAAMRQVQPEGPYLLGGWSFGGLVAFEMACMLREQGHEVGRLLLFDTQPPQEAPPSLRERLLTELARRALLLVLRVPSLRPWMRPLLKPIEELTPVWRLFVAFIFTGLEDVRRIIPFAFPEADRRRLESLQEDEAWAYALELARAGDAPADRVLLLPGLDGAGARRALGVSRRLEELAGSFQARQRYPGDLDIIAVRGNKALHRWERHVEGRVDIHWFDLEKRYVNAHFDMMEELNVPRFAGAVRELLQRADG